MSPQVNEQELPGIGRRFGMECAEGGSAVVVIHHSGRRDLYVVTPGEEEPDCAVALTDAQARTLGSILSGAYFKPAVVEEMEAVIGALLIDWVTLKEDSPAVGRSIAELEVRPRTNMTVAAIQRGDESIIAPGPDERFEAGDRLVVVGRREDLSGFVRHMVG